MTNLMTAKRGAKRKQAYHTKKRQIRRGWPIRVEKGYRRRWIIERCFEWMSDYHRLVVELLPTLRSTIWFANRFLFRIPTPIKNSPCILCIN